MTELFKTDTHGLVEGIGEVSVVDAEQVQGLSQQGWRLLKIVSSQSKESLCKQFPYLPPGSYSPSTYPYSEDAVIQRSKFVMGRPGDALKDEVQAKLDQALCAFREGRAEHEKTRTELVEAKKAFDKKGDEVVRVSIDLKTMTERFEKMSAAYDDTKKKYDNLQRATLETLVKLPGGNEVSIDGAGKMLRTSEILGGEAKP